jgi:hypothetical protein
VTCPRSPRTGRVGSGDLSVGALEIGHFRPRTKVAERRDDGSQGASAPGPGGSFGCVAARRRNRLPAIPHEPFDSPRPPLRVVRRSATPSQKPMHTVGVAHGYLPPVAPRRLKVAKLQGDLSQGAAPRVVANGPSIPRTCPSLVRLESFRGRGASVVLRSFNAR